MVSGSSSARGERLIDRYAPGGQGGQPAQRRGDRGPFELGAQAEGGGVGEHLVGAQRGAVGVGEPGQRLEPDRPAAAQLDDGLQVHLAAPAVQQQGEGGGLRRPVLLVLLLLRQGGADQRGDGAHGLQLSGAR